MHIIYTSECYCYRCSYKCNALAAFCCPLVGRHGGQKSCMVAAIRLLHEVHLRNDYRFKNYLVKNYPLRGIYTLSDKLRPLLRIKNDVSGN